MTRGDLVDDAAWHSKFAAIEREVDAIKAAEGEFQVRYVEAERCVANGETTTHVVWKRET
jgi:hypothetical protein